jgi:hypothetical protein
MAAVLTGALASGALKKKKKKKNKNPIVIIIINCMKAGSRDE